MSSHDHPTPARAESPSDGQRITLRIDGMSCGHCVAAVRAALHDLPGVTIEGVAIGSATLLAPAADAPSVTDAALHAVQEAGYEARVGAAGDSGTPDVPVVPLTARRR